jgi:hypothetical protein
VDVPLKEATLTEFGKAGSMLGNRLYTRVQPKEPIAAEIKIGRHLLPCQLVDISLSGVGVITLGTYTYGKLGTRKGGKVQLYFSLPPTHMPVHDRASYEHCGHSNTDQHRLGCKLSGQQCDLLLWNMWHCVATS